MHPGPGRRHPGPGVALPAATAHTVGVRSALILAVALLVGSVAGTASGGRQTLLVRDSLSGEIQQLGPGKIEVGHVRCSVPPKLALRAGRFVIGDPVSIACLGGQLQSVRYTPEAAANQTSKPGGGNAPTTVAAQQGSCGIACASKISYSMGTVFLGGGPTGDTATAAGQITDISGSSVTAGGLTCSDKLASTAAFNEIVRVGDNVTMTCTGGVLVSLKSVGAQSRA